tara:strand:+ start:62 stop:256 length:195 start_codon:yes stop_codon:yes gene_type:complete
MIIVKNNIPIITPFSNLKDAIYYSKLYKKLSHDRIINMVNLKREIDNGCSYGEKIDSYVNKLFM